MFQIALGYGYSFLTAIIVILGDVVIKHAADTVDGQRQAAMALILGGCALYAVSALMWYGAMRNVTLAQAGVAYAMLSLIALCLLGAILFGERIGGREMAGIACALAAMVLMVRVEA